MSWELANEPRGGKFRKEFLAWIRGSAKLIKSLDQNHLITIGSEGETLNPKDAGNDFIEDHAIAEIDYATIHIWVENWGSILKFLFEGMIVAKPFLLPCFLPR